MKGFILMLIVLAQLIILIVTGENTIPYCLLTMYVVINSVWELAERK